MSTNVFTHPLLSGLFSTGPYKQFWTADAHIKHLVDYETAWTKALAHASIISAEETDAALKNLHAFEPDYKTLNAGVTKDGVIIPALILKLREGLSHGKAIHFGSTSQDVIDTSFSLTLNALNKQYITDLEQLIGQLDNLKEKFGANQMMAQTRMQNALPIAVSHKLENWRMPLVTLSKELEDFDFPMQIGGAVGDNQMLSEHASQILASVADQLDLTLPAHSWHTDRNLVCKYASFLARLSGAIGKIGQDICLLALVGKDITISGAGSSSAMPHKQNPVLAELLVTCAQFNAGQSGTITQSMIHENERSGSAWMLEWMTLPQMTLTTGCSILTAKKIFDSVQTLGN